MVNLWAMNGHCDRKIYPQRLQVIVGICSTFLNVLLISLYSSRLYLFLFFSSEKLSNQYKLDREIFCLSIVFLIRPVI